MTRNLREPVVLAALKRRIGSGLSRATVIVAAFCGLGGSAGADWPEFRGPTGQGIADATGLPVNWSEESNVAWKVPLEGLAWSSPVIVDGRIYLTNAVEIGPQHYSLRAICLKASSGEIVWTVEVFEQEGAVEIHRTNSHASPTPIVEDGKVYVHFGPHGTACLTTDGEVLWRMALEYLPVHGNGGSPASAGDLLIISCDGRDKQFVVGIEKATGEERWRTPRDTNPVKGFSFSTPLIIEAGGRRQAVCPGSDAVFAYDPATGEQLWRVDYTGGFSVVPRPAFAGGLVFVCTGFGTPKLMAIDPTGTGNVTDTHVRWEIKRGAPHNPSPLPVGDELYFLSDQGVATCVDVQTGEEHWQERLGGQFWASPLYADGKIYFQDQHGGSVVVKAGTEFVELARNQLGAGERSFASYGVVDGALFIRTEEALYRVEESE
ncbi:MAG: hypothetical protein DWQ45_26730 [Planctomycetota bacterium]|nr:MAG: hypothetical protein DWQ29_06075 [Planctomycetota bacterium]REK20335.1 MAG: hypothetical protein DWQ41_25430 [Planctomycetota bacterium]REK26832.1 MAG: hypothetical protein DWQ45_26730 [Planctomycetota bacterium]